MKNQIKQQTKSDALWIDESGNSIQYMRTTPSERLKESVAFKAAKEAIAINAELVAFKERLIQNVEKVFETFKNERQIEKIGKGKGGFSFYNFDRTIKIEKLNNDDIRFDDLLVAGAKEIFDRFFDENITSTDEVIKGMVLNAFASEKGKLNKNKILELISYKSKVLNQDFKKACDMLSEAMKVSGSRTYYKVSVKQEDNSYRYIQLDLNNV